MMFAALTLEQEPPQWADFPAAVVGWVRIAGTVAAIGLAIWLLAYALQHPRLLAALGMRPRRPDTGARPWPLEAVLFAIGASVTGLLYAAAFVLMAAAVFAPDRAPVAPRPETESGAGLSLPSLCFTLAGAAALLTVALPMLLAIFTRLSGRRIWALARLSFKEAIHSRVVWIFALVCLVFLVLSWFVSYKPEDQLRNYLWAIHLIMLIVFALAASILGAFTIPADLRRQSIQTVVTKPVERFEIFLGRFLGFGIVLTAGLAILGGVSLLYLARGLSDEAAQESYKARMPVFGNLAFWGTEGAPRFEGKGINVGLMWGYRSYITGKDPRARHKPQQYAVWAFDRVPDVGDQSNVRVEFTFDIFRVSKGEKEQPGVPCTFIFADVPLDATDQLDVQAIGKRLLAYQKEEHALASMKKEERDQALIQKYNLYARSGQKVLERRRTQSLDVPAAFFRRMADLSATAFDGQTPRPAFTVLVAVDEQGNRQTQMLGMARRDLYLLPAVGPFEFNFFKGLIGLWFLTLLILGIGLTLSTYLSGVIAWLATLFLFFLGSTIDYIRQLALNLLEGGGPFVASIRLARARPSAAELEQGAGTELAMALDASFRWLLENLVLPILPDVNRFDLQEYVASGFDISWSEILLLSNLLPLVAYLLPCAILAYYLLRFREVANPS